MSEYLNFTSPFVWGESYQKDGCHRHKSHPGRACSRSQNAHRCTDQRGESLNGILISDGLITKRIRMVPLTARATGARDLVLSGSLVAGAVESGLLAAGALGLGSADAASILGGLAAGRNGVDHFDGVVGRLN